MKKILFIVAAIAAISFTACCNKTQNNCENDSTCTDTCCNEVHFCPKALNEAIEAKDATTFQQKIEEAKAFIAELIEKGKTEEAAKYTEQLQQFLADNKAKIEEFAAGNETLNQLIDNVTSLPTDVAALATSLGVQAKDAAIDAKEAVEGAAADAVAAGQQKVEDAKNAAAEKANETIETGKQKTNEAIETGKKKTGEAIDNAANEVKRGLGL